MSRRENAVMVLIVAAVLSAGAWSVWEIESNRRRLAETRASVPATPELDALRKEVKSVIEMIEADTRRIRAENQCINASARWYECESERLRGAPVSCILGDVVQDDEGEWYRCVKAEKWTVVPLTE